MDQKQLKKLKDEWNKKLEKEGLKDIENKSGCLQKYHAHWYKSPRVGYDYEATFQYYRNCEHFLNDHKFKSEEKKVWELYSDGATRLVIVEKTKLTEGQVIGILRRLREELDKWIKLERISDDF